MSADPPLSEALDQRFDSLWQWLSRKYCLDQIEVAVGGHGCRLMTIADADQAIDDALAETTGDGHITPYWATLWPSALALGEFIAERPEALRQPLLELGCGMGLAGITAGRFTDNVILSDNAPDALRLAELNWIINHRRPVQTQPLDWRKSPSNRRYPLILAADVAFESPLIAPLCHTLDTLLGENGVIWLSEPNRPVATPLFDQLAANGFVWEKFSQKVILAEIETDVAVYIIQRK